MNINVDVRVAHFTSNVEPYQGVNIEIKDEASHKRIATITMTPLEFYGMMANRGGKGTAEILDFDQYLKVGKNYVYQAVELPSEISDRFFRERSVTPEMHALGRDERDRLDMDGYRWTKHNYGWGLGVWKYE